MAIESEITIQASGQVRAHYKVTLADGRVFAVGPINCVSLEDAEQRKAAIEARVIQSVSESDADEAAEGSTVAAHKTSTINQVRAAILKRGMQADSALVAYQAMSKVMPDLLALNRTNTQLAAMFNTTIEAIQRIKQRWQYLSDNAATINGYRTVQQGFN